MSLIGPAMTALNVLFGLQAAKDLMGGASSSGLFDSFPWSGGAKENQARMMAANAGTYEGIDRGADSAFESSLNQRLRSFGQYGQGAGTSGRQGQLGDMAFMRDMQKLYRDELAKASVQSFPSVGEVAAKAGLFQ